MRGSSFKGGVRDIFWPLLILAYVLIFAVVLFFTEPAGWHEEIKNEEAYVTSVEKIDYNRIVTFENGSTMEDSKLTSEAYIGIIGGVTYRPALKRYDFYANRTNCIVWERYVENSNENGRYIFYEKNPEIRPWHIIDVREGKC